MECVRVPDRGVDGDWGGEGGGGEEEAWVEMAREEGGAVGEGGGEAMGFHVVWEGWVEEWGLLSSSRGCPVFVVVQCSWFVVRGCPVFFDNRPSDVIPLVSYGLR